MSDIIELPKFSVSLSVYKNDNPEYFREAFNSIINQTIKPAEIVLVVDGPVPVSIKNTILKFEREFQPFKIIYLPVNKGHAISRQTGMESTSHEIVALMDSDDIAVSNRFEKQLKCFNVQPGLDVLGGQINEFIDNIDNIAGTRKVPLDDIEIKNYLKKRCPFNQQTVMLRKSSLLSAGGYIDWHYEEDYYLWIRMFKKGCKFSNLPDNLVYVRVGSEMYKRRGGLKYFNSEAKLQKYMLDNDIINLPLLLSNVLIRFIVQILLPNKIRGLIFKKFFRKTNRNEK